MYETFLNDVLRDMTQEGRPEVHRIRRVPCRRRTDATVRDDLAERLEGGARRQSRARRIAHGRLRRVHNSPTCAEGVAKLGSKASPHSASPRRSRARILISPVLMEFAKTPCRFGARGTSVRSGSVAPCLLGKAGPPPRSVARGNGGLVSSVYSKTRLF